MVGINYAPEHTGIAPYTTRACEHLVRSGAEVLAVAGIPHYPHWSIPADYRFQLRTHELVGRVNVRRLRHTVPTRQSARKRATYEATFGANVLGQRLPWRPDVVLGVIPSLFGAAAAAVLARRNDAPLVLWVQDLMGPAASQSGIAGGGRIAALTSTIEKRTLRQANAVLIVSGAFRSYLRSAGVSDQDVHVIPNWTHVKPASQDRKAVRQRLGWAEDEIVALHSGNMGLKQGLENLVEAAKLVQQPLRIVLMGDGNQRAALEVLGADVPGLQMLPPVSADDFPDVLCAADVLLVNERASAVEMSLPSKLTSYFGAAVPVLAAVSPKGGTAEELRRSGGGRLVPPGDPAALVAALSRLAADPAARAQLGAAGAIHARKHLDRRVSLDRLESVLSKVMAAGRSGA